MSASSNPTPTLNFALFATDTPEPSDCMVSRLLGKEGHLAAAPMTRIVKTNENVVARWESERAATTRQEANSHKPTSKCTPAETAKILAMQTQACETANRSAMPKCERAAIFAKVAIVAMSIAEASGSVALSFFGPNDGHLAAVAMTRIATARDSGVAWWESARAATMRQDASSRKPTPRCTPESVAKLAEIQMQGCVAVSLSKMPNCERKATFT